MTLADVSLPVTYEWGRQHALVFAADLANRIAEVQHTHGDFQNRVVPVPLSDGRWMLSADVLTWVMPGKPWHAGFSQLDAARFDEIEVVPLADALAMLPEPESP